MEEITLSIQDLFNTSSNCLSHQAMVKSYIEVIRAYQTVFNIIFDIDSYEQD